MLMLTILLVEKIIKKLKVSHFEFFILENTLVFILYIIIKQIFKLTFFILLIMTANVLYLKTKCLKNKNAKLIARTRFTFFKVIIFPKLGFDVDSRNDYIHIRVCQTKNAKLGDIFKARIINPAGVWLPK